MEKTLEVIDDFFISKEYLNVVKYCCEADYYWGERDTEQSSPTGMVHEIYDCEDKPVEENNQWIYDLFFENTNHLCPNLKLYRMYVNSFAPGENPYFHTDSVDSGDLTFLYYVPSADWDINDGGETQFYYNGDMIGVTPVPNRMVYFDATILHRATSFRDRWRWTVAIKFSKTDGW